LLHLAQTGLRHRHPGLSLLDASDRLRIQKTDPGTLLLQPNPQYRTGLRVRGSWLLSVWANVISAPTVGLLAPVARSNNDRERGESTVGRRMCASRTRVHGRIARCERFADKAHGMLRYGLLVAAMSSFIAFLQLSGAQTEKPADLVLENQQCRIEFDRRTGGLRRIVNRLIPDESLKGIGAEACPFRIYSDFTKEFELGDDPAAISRAVMQPGNSRLARVSGDAGLSLCYERDGLEARLQVTLTKGAGASDWSLRVTNRSAETREVMVSFPCLDGVRLGREGATDLATVMSQAGMIGPAWAQGGGVVGNGGQMSMQWHAIWDPDSGSALGLIMMDPAAQPKALVLHEPSIEVRYFPPRNLAPGESIELPAARLLVYRGDWRPAARAYRAWYSRAFKLAEPPQWFRHSDGCEGRHFKQGGPGIAADHGGQFVLESFKELPAAHLRVPIDNLEYAFYSRGSMLHGVHTDGDNIVREDMGGAAAMKEGIAGVHRLGLHATLYIEGYIVHQQSDLARSGKAERWSVMHKDGSITGPYTSQGFYHMCPGCVEWQDHLAHTVERLLRETGADGVRLDSLGFYFLPCYNPAHAHATPFGYNEWMKQLLSKVRRAALAVNPDALLTTEAPVDWFGQWFHGALTQVYPRDLPPMRLAVGPYRPYVYAQGGPVWGAVSGLAGGRSCWEADLEALEANWLCARFPAHEALVWGDVADQDPRSSDAEIVTRCFEGRHHWAVVAVRPASQDRFAWPQYTGISDHRSGYTLTLPGLAEQVEDAVLCDVETLTWSRLPLRRSGQDVVMNLRTNFALVVFRRPRGPAVVGFQRLRPLAPGGSVELHLAALSGGAAGGVRVIAPGLRVTPRDVEVPGTVNLTVPADALRGNYAVCVSGKNVLGVKRLLVVQ